MMNQISLIGRLTAKPELKATSSGISVCSFSIAVERDVADADGNRTTDFIDVVTWRASAEFVSRYFDKGQLIAVAGSLQSRHWEDKNGQKRTAWEVQAQSCWFCGGRNDIQR